MAQGLNGCNFIAHVAGYVAKMRKAASCEAAKESIC